MELKFTPASGTNGIGNRDCFIAKVDTGIIRVTTFYIGDQLIAETCHVGCDRWKLNVEELDAICRRFFTIFKREHHTPVLDVDSQLVVIKQKLPVN